MDVAHNQWIIRLYLSMCLCVSTMLCHASSQAAEPQEDLLDMSLQELMQVSIVTTSTKNSISLNNAPAQIYLITREKIRQRGYQDIEDLLADIPSVEIQRHSGAGLGNAYIVVANDF